MGRLHLQGIIQDMEDNFNYKKFIAEGRLFEEAKTIDVYGDGDVVVDISKATPEQERVINFEFEVSEFSNSEEAQEVVDQIMNLNSSKEVKNYYDNVRGWATVDYLDTYKALNAFVGNKPIAEGKLLKEDITKLRGQELLDFFKFTKYMDVDVEALETEFIEAINGGWFTDPSNFEEEKKDFTYESGDRFLDTNEDKMSEYLGFEIDTFRMSDDYTMGDPMGVEFVHSDEDFEGWMDEVGSFWD